VEKTNRQKLMQEQISVEAKQEEGWSEVISPQTSLLDLRLGDVWRYRDLLWLFVKRDFAAQYKQTVLGPVWHFIQPIFTTVMFVLVFGKIANIPTDGIPALLFFMSGITIWNYFSSCVTSTSNTFVTNAGIFGKVYFPRLVLPISVVVSNIVRFGIQFLLLLATMVYCHVKHVENYQLHISINWLLIPVLVAMMAGIGLSIGIIISSLTTKYRDFTVLVGFAVQLAMYITPIVYPVSYLLTKAPKYVFIIKWNPLTPLIEGFKYALFGKPVNFEYSSLLYSLLFMCISFFIGAIMFNKVEKSFMDTV
jgi:lipopolysaccharide transport system permease protein